MSEVPREGGAKSFRRARESILLRADGMRVPEEVVSTLDEAEIEVSGSAVNISAVGVTICGRREC